MTNLPAYAMVIVCVLLVVAAALRWRQNGGEWLFWRSHADLGRNNTPRSRGTRHRALVIQDVYACVTRCMRAFRDHLGSHHPRTISMAGIENFI